MNPGRKNSAGDLTTATRTGVVAFVICLLVLQMSVMSAHAASEKYFLYLPTPLGAGDLQQREGGVVVKKIIIQPGDTLTDLSREYSGKGYYFPQILLFNKIRNPDLIYAGRRLLVPVSAKILKMKKTATAHTGKSHVPVRSGRGVHSSRMAAPGKAKAISFRERHTYQKAIALYEKGKYRDAIAAFSHFMKKYPSSSFVPDATLYRSDCYLRRSGLKELP